MAIQQLKFSRYIRVVIGWSSIGFLSFEIIQIIENKNKLQCKSRGGKDNLNDLIECMQLKIQDDHNWEIEIEIERVANGRVEGKRGSNTYIYIFNSYIKIAHCWILQSKCCRFDQWIEHSLHVDGNAHCFHIAVHFNHVDYGSLALLIIIEFIAHNF